MTGTALLQASKVDPLTAKYFNWQSFFKIFVFFACTPLAWAYGLWFKLFRILVLISQPYPTRFQ